MNLASVRLEPGQFVVTAPQSLITWIQLLKASSGTPEDKQRIYQEQLSNWYVICSITGENVLLSDLSYWNVETDAIYKSPQVMPLYDRYE